MEILDSPRSHEGQNAVARLLSDHTGLKATDADLEKALVKLRRKYPKTVGDDLDFEDYLRARWHRETAYCRNDEAERRRLLRPGAN